MTELNGKNKYIQAQLPPIKAVQFHQQQNLPQRLNTGWQKLSVQAARINQLSAELEAEMLELKAIAFEVNRTQQIAQGTKKPPKSVCEYLTASVPHVKQKKAGAIVLTNRSVDLFRAEREAAQAAKKLRRRGNKTKSQKSSIMFKIVNFIKKLVLKFSRLWQR